MFQVPIFHSLDDLILDNICDRVKPLVFSKGEKVKTFSYNDYVLLAMHASKKETSNYARVDILILILSIKTRITSMKYNY